MPSKKPKKQRQKKNPTASLTGYSTETTPEVKPPDAPQVGVTSQQEPTDGRAELLRLEKETAPKPPAEKQPAGGSAPAQDAPKEPGDAPKRRRKFKRPPPENTIRMTIRQYWRFRTWIANRKLGLPSDVIGAVLEGTDQVLVEPLVEPVVGIIDEYVPEQWIEFIEEKSPLLTFLIALFEAEQTFAARLSEIAREVKKESPAQTTPTAPQRTVYPSI